MKNRSAALLAGVIALAGPLRAGGFSSSAKGTSAADFLKIGVGARPLALGEAYTALADDALALSWNPAGLSRTPHLSVVLAHTAYLESINFEHAAVALKLPLGLAVGGALQFQTVGDVTGRDSAGAATGGLSPKDMAFALGAAQSLGVVSVGLAGRFVKSELADAANTVAFDAGVLTGPMLGDRVRLGATAANLGGKLKFDDASNPLPVTYRAGGAVRLSPAFLVSADAILRRDNKPVAAGGLEWNLPATSGWTFAVRGGYNTRTAGDVGGLTGLSAGLGFGFKTLQIDYALVPLGDLGLTHRLSLSYRL
ncbi:MAG: PorV/PorQ family protein [Elusimicrobia bacterium]|nr:PorV/PorQ family protein [Elusimicrobiota bacterium]